MKKLNLGWAWILLLQIALSSEVVFAKNCVKGKSCGDSCIPQNHTCRIGSGSYSSPTTPSSSDTSSSQGKIKIPEVKLELKDDNSDKPSETNISPDKVPPLHASPQNYLHKDSAPNVLKNSLNLGKATLVSGAPDSYTITEKDDLISVLSHFVEDPASVSTLWRQKPDLRPFDEIRLINRDKEPALQITRGRTVKLSPTIKSSTEGDRKSVV